MDLKKSTARRVAVRVEDSQGTGVTGLLFNNVDLSVFIAKENGAEVQKTLVAGDFNAAGHGGYWLLLSAADTDTRGTLLVTVVYQGSEYQRDFEVLDYLPDEAALAVDYTAARAAKLDFLDVAVTSRLAGASYVAPDNATVAAIQVDTAALLSLVDELYGFCGKNTHETLNFNAGVLQSAQLKAYDTAANANAGGATGLLYTFDMAYEYPSANQTIIKVTKA